MTRAQRETPDLDLLEIVILTLFGKSRAFTSSFALAFQLCRLTAA